MVNMITIASMGRVGGTTRGVFGMDGTVETFGAMVRRRRKLRRWSQEMLGRQADGLDQATVSLVEHDKGRPTLDTVGRLASAFGEDPQEWFHLANLIPRPPAETAPTGDGPFDPLKIVAFIESHPDPVFQKDLADLKRDYPGAAYERMCMSIYRAWTSNGFLALNVAKEVGG